MGNTLHFKTNTLLKNLVGKDLINDDNIAIVELVKNAYDSGSASIVVRFEKLNKDGTPSPDSRLVISDKGSGMNEKDIEDKWLNIAYSEKKLKPRQHGAYLAGNKGIGRFSCDRLGARLDMLTRVQGGNLLYLPIEWSKFEIEGKQDLTIQQIELSLNSISESQAKAVSGQAMPLQGTILTISELRSSWERDKLLQLKRDLGKFLNPNQFFGGADFKIELQVPSRKKEDEGCDYASAVNGVIQNQIFEKLAFNATFIQSEIDENGKTVKTKLSHEGHDVFRVEEKNTRYPELKNAKVFIYYLNPYKKAYFKRQTGIRSVEFGSIFLFLNGFRVAPYGERGDDWLGLDVRKAQGVARYLGSRELVGRIEIADNDDRFQPISSREGLKKTRAFIELKDKYFLAILRQLEKFVVDGLGWDSMPASLRDFGRNEEGLDWKVTSEEYAESWDRKRQRIALTIMPLIGTSREEVISLWFNPSLLEGLAEQRAEEMRDLIGVLDGFDQNQIDVDLKSNVRQVAKLLEAKEREAAEAKTAVATLLVTVARQSERVEKLKKETDTYRAQTLFLQSVSTLDAKDLLAFHHQICFEATILDNYLAKAIRAARLLPKSTELLDALEKVGISNKRIIATAQFATKANFKANSKKELTDVPAFVEQYVLNVAKEFIAAGLHVTVQNAVKEAFEIRASRIELSILIDNIFGNANKAQAKRMLIKIDFLKKNLIRILFRDDGVGLSGAIKKPEDVFDLGVTTTKGSGIGLYYARQIVEAMGGKLSARPASPKGFEIEMELMR